MSELQAIVPRQKRKRGTQRSYIRSDTNLTGAEGQSQIVTRSTASNSRRFGRCKEIGRNSRTCSTSCRNQA
ncbi:hypothetical protein V1509DRAFT_30723 [Lipomyces kononenkoae]